MTKCIRYCLFVVFSAVLGISCTEMDETYHEFIKDGEIVYAGKPSYFTAMSGNRRMVMYFQLLADPKIVKATIYWSNPTLPAGVDPQPGQRPSGKDSLEIDLTETGTGYTRAFLPSAMNTYYYLVPVPNLVEGVYSFQIYTFDNNGNSSVKAETIGEVYGEAFQNSITNRPLERAVIYNQFNNPDGKLDLEWLGAAKAIVAVDVKYTNRSDQVTIYRDKKVYIDPDRPPVFLPRTIVPDYKPGTIFEYRTGFVPNTLAADTFWTEYKPGPTVQTDRMIRPGIYKLKVKHSGQSLKIRSNATTANAQVEQNDYDGLLSGQWKVLYNIDGFVVLKNANSSMDMAVAGGVTTDGTNIQQIVQLADTYDEWTLEPADAGKQYFRLKNRKTAKVAGIQSGSATKGTSLQQQTLVLTANHQQFEFEFLQDLTN